MWRSFCRACSTWARWRRLCARCRTTPRDCRSAALHRRRSLLASRRSGGSSSWSSRLADDTRPRSPMHAAPSTRASLTTSGLSPPNSYSYSSSFLSLCFLPSFLRSFAYWLVCLFIAFFSSSLKPAIAYSLRNLLYYRHMYWIECAFHRWFEHSGRSKKKWNCLRSLFNFNHFPLVFISQIYWQKHRYT